MGGVLVSIRARSGKASDKAKGEQRPEISGRLKNVPDGGKHQGRGRRQENA